MQKYAILDKILMLKKKHSENINKAPGGIELVIYY